MCGAAGRGRWSVATPSGTSCRRRVPDSAPGRRLRRQRVPGAGGTSPLPRALPVQWATPAGARTTPRAGGSACGVWSLHAASHPRSRWGHLRPSAALSACRRRRVVWAWCWCQRVPAALGASGSFTQDVGGVSPSGSEPGMEGARVHGLSEAGRRTQRATPALCAGRAIPLAARRAQRLRRAVSHGLESGGEPCRRGRGGVRGPASPVAWASCLGVRHTAPVIPGAWPHRSIVPGWGGAHRAQPPSRWQAQGRQTGGHAEGVMSCPCGP